MVSSVSPSVNSRPVGLQSWLAPQWLEICGAVVWKEISWDMQSFRVGYPGSMLKVIFAGENLLRRGFGKELC